MVQFVIMSLPLTCLHVCAQIMVVDFEQFSTGWKVILEAFDIAAGSVSSCIQTLSEDHILAISPGGVREAQFSDHNYQLIWGNRTGYAKVALGANSVSNSTSFYNAYWK